MAEENQESEEKKGSGNLILIIIIAVASLAIGGGGAWFFLGSKQEPVVAGEEEVVEEMVMANVIYHELHPAFVANFAGKSKKKFMQVYMVASMHDETVRDALDLHMPVLRNNILMTLSTKGSDDVATVEGKEMLRQEVLSVIQSTLEEKTGKPGIDDLFFTKFVAQ